MVPWLERAGGALVAAALALALVVGLGFAWRTPELAVRVRANAPYAVARAPGEAGPEVSAGPPDLLARLERGGARDREGPGLSLRIWQLTYGRRWQREVALPVLQGPFDEEGARWPCAVAVRLAPSLFGSELVALVDARVRRMFPRTARPPMAQVGAAVGSRFGTLGAIAGALAGQAMGAVAPDVATVRFPAVQSTSIQVQLEDGAARVPFVITLRDGTRFAGRVRVAFAERGDQVVAAPALEAFSWTGPTRDAVQARAADLAAGIVGAQTVDRIAQEVASREITQHVSDVIEGAMAQVRQPVPIFQDRPGDVVRARLCRAPQISRAGVSVELALGATFSAARAHDAAPGPVHVEAPVRAPVGAAPAGPRAIEASVSPAAVNQLLYVLWRTERMREWGRDRRVIEAMSREINNRLTFTPDRLEPTMPPTLVLDDAAPAGSFRVRVANVALGQMADGRTVMVHGDVFARAHLAAGGEGAVRLSGRFTGARANCAAPAGAQGWVLTPCLSDAIRVARSGGHLERAFEWDLDRSTIDRFLAVNLGHGLELQLTDLAVSTEGAPAYVRVGANVRVVDRGAATR